MKKIYLTIISSLFLLGITYSQNEIDALRYSRNFYGGTARSVSMAGAFGSLGGDFSSLSINPAGIGVYRSTEFTLSPSLLHSNTAAGYLGTEQSDDRYQFFLNNLGIVSTKLTGKDEGWVSMTFGVGYNRLNHFHRNTLIRARMSSAAPGVSPLPPPTGSPSSSYLDNFTNNANDGVWSDLYEELAWNANLLPYDTVALEYWNDINNAGYGQLQRRSIREKGATGEYAFSFGANYANKLYFGATFGIHRLKFSQYIDHHEVDDQETIDYFDSFTFREDLEVYGTGYTFKLGMIYRPINLIRLGAAFHIPTFYKISEDFYTWMSSKFDSWTGEEDGYERAPLNTFDYWLRTPYRIIGSAAIQLPKLAIISVDYEFVDYSQANMDSRDWGFFDENQVIKDVYKATSNIRAGAEVHLGPVYLRGGTAYYGSPYVSGEVNEDAYSLIVSGGLGFRSDKFFFDVAYSHKMHEEVYYMYIPEDINGTTVDQRTNIFMTTLGFRF